jgi:hypothetical protein
MGFRRGNGCGFIVKSSLDTAGASKILNHARNSTRDVNAGPDFSIVTVGGPDPYRMP